MVASVYMESSVVSYLSSHPSKDLVTAARQVITAEWWHEIRSEYDIYVSLLVEKEIARGDTEAAKRRLVYIEEIPALDISDQENDLAKALIASNAIPENSAEDALHIGICAAAGIDYLLTWNFKHTNNVKTRAKIEEVIESCGYICPVLCSPEELGV